jgi:SAM-dependent methyltransferase
MGVDRRVMRRYEASDEEGRLWRPGRGDLIRLRTWDIFERFLPASGRVLDVGGGPGAHAARLAARGYDVTLVDPVGRHLDLATRRAAAGPAPFAVQRGEARHLSARDGCVDVVLLMGPLYHLPDPSERADALAEVRRVLRPGGVVLAEIITRHAWVLDATLRELLDEPGIWEDFGRNIELGLSQDPAYVPDGSFWAYFHGPDELRGELVAGGFDPVALVAVEGFGWLLDGLEQRMADPEPLLRVLRLTESEPTMLGCSAHVIGVATRA